MKQALLKLFLLSTSLLPLCGVAQAQEQKTDEFELGTITIVGHRRQVGEVGLGQAGERISSEDVARYNRKDIGDALDLATGVTLSTNSRNEKLIYIRGFDTQQVPLFIDGIPVYVPYDGYVDFSRFTTDDLYTIQVAKGFSSISYGANTLGGAVNLVSRKPTKPLEGNFRAGLGSGGEQNGALNIGTNQGFWYLQAGLSGSKAETANSSGNPIISPAQLIYFGIRLANVMLGDFSAGYNISAYALVFCRLIVGCFIH